MNIIPLFEMVMPTVIDSLMSYQQLIVWLIVLIAKVATATFLIWFIVKKIGLKITIGG